LEDLAISMCTLDASIEITPDSMPRLRRLDATDVSVLVGKLTTLHLSCHHRCSSMESPSSDPGWFLVSARF
jgi:hypothetical protein